MAVFWDVTPPCSRVDTDPRFRGLLPPSSGWMGGDGETLWLTLLYHCYDSQTGNILICSVSSCDGGIEKPIRNFSEESTQRAVTENRRKICDNIKMCLHLSSSSFCPVMAASC
jgi:hypothetical protein